MAILQSKPVFSGLNMNHYTADAHDLMIGPLLADAYKLMHPELYHEETSKMQGNCIARSAKHFKNKSKFYDNTYVVSGVNMAVKRLQKAWDQFFHNPWAQNKIILDLIIPSMTGQNDYSRLKALHDLGYLPIKVTSAPEGSSVRIGNAFLLVEDTIAEFSWLTIYVETFLLSMTWYSCTVATTAREFYRVLYNCALDTADDLGFLDWAVHDFSLRGLAGIDAALAKGPGHLMFFKGTDDIANVLENIADYAATKADYGSVLATEHSVATSNIMYTAVQFREETGADELDLDNAEKTWLQKLLKKFIKGHLSYVGDSFNYFKLLAETIPALKEEILARDGTFVLRGDSGNPVEIICGIKCYPKTFNTLQDFINEVYDQGTYTVNQYGVVQIDSKFYRLPENPHFGLDALYEMEKTAEVSEIEVKGTLQSLWDTFGGTINSKGYKVLDSHVRIIYGDGINIQRLEVIVERFKEMGFSIENLVIGIGGGAYQWISRDTLGFAMKATYAEIDGKDVEVFKQPKTDLSKSSVKGWVVLKYEPVSRIWYSIDQQEPGSNDRHSLIRFKDSELHNLDELQQVRNNAIYYTSTSGITTALDK